MDDSPAKIYSDQRNVVTYISDSGHGFRLPFREHWRTPDAMAAVAGFVLTAALTTNAVRTGNGDARTILLIGLGLTVTAVWLLDKLPRQRPGLRTRALFWATNLRPRVQCTHPRRDDTTP